LHKIENELTYIDIELSDETGEIVMFEIIGEKSERELINVGDDETVTSLGPIDDGIG
jgi:hypothetical protein